MPVVSMSTRALMGIVHAFEVPGILSAWFISSTNWSVEIWPGVNLRNMPFAHLGAQEEYQVSTFRDSASGLRTIMVSIMENGAGPVDVSARPALPSTEDTSGNCLMMRSCTCINCCACVTPMPGRVDGMYINEPSSRGGMNSEPRLWNTGMVKTTNATAAAITSHFHRNASSHTGAYNLIRILLIGCVSSEWIVPTRPALVTRADRKSV